MLLDGNYQLVIDSSKVLRNGLAMDGDADGVAGGDILWGDEQADAFYALYGDVNGDRTVGFSEFLGFSPAYDTQVGDANYDELFDYDMNGAIGFPDFLKFSANYGKNLDFE